MREMWEKYFLKRLNESVILQLGRSMVSSKHSYFSDHSHWAELVKDQFVLSGSLISSFDRIRNWVRGWGS